MPKVVRYGYLIIAFVLAKVMNSPIILAFHRIKHFDNHILDHRIGVIEPDIFKKVINFLQKSGYTFVALSDLKSDFKNKLNGKIAVLTFDDGYRDLYTNVYPILKSKGIPYTLFLTTSSVDSKELLWYHKLYLAIDKLTINHSKSIINNIQIQSEKVFETLPNDVIMHQNIDEAGKICQILFDYADIEKEDEMNFAKSLYLTSREVNEMIDHGMEVELHSHKHYPYTNMEEAEIEKDILSSFYFIDKSFNKKPEFWCLPFGLKNNLCINIALKYRLQGIISGPGSVVTKHTDMFNLPRIEFDNNIYSFYKKISKAYIKSILKRS